MLSSQHFKLFPTNHKTEIQDFLTERDFALNSSFSNDGVIQKATMQIYLTCL